MLTGYIWKGGAVRLITCYLIQTGSPSEGGGLTLFSGRGKIRQEYMDEIKEGRKYVVIKTLTSGEKKLQAYRTLS